MTREVLGKVAIIVLVAAFLFVMTSLSMEGRYIPEGWDERVIMAVGFLGLTATAALGWADRL